METKLTAAPALAEEAGLVRVVVLLVVLGFAFGLGVDFTDGLATVFGGLQIESIQRSAASADFGIEAN
ncbi:MAG: hypothetical protein ACKOXT_00360 [Actinomycetota bacterium]